jgi:TonB family protein
VRCSSDPNSSLDDERHRSESTMNPVRLDSAPTEFRLPETPLDDTGDVTLVRGRPPLPLRPAADAHDDVEDSPLARLILSHERPHPTLPPLRDPSLPRCPERTKGLPVTVLTSDAAFANQIRSALDATSDLTVVSTADEAAALAVSGRCPILITDESITRSAIESLKSRLRAHDPAVALIAAGNRDQGGLLIGLQSSGAVDAFLLKPVTAGATQVVVESATKRYRAHGANADTGSDPARRVRTRTPRLQRSASLSRADATALATPTIEARVPARTSQTIAPMAQDAPAPKHRALRPSWLLMVAAAAAVGGIVWWIMWQRMPEIDPQRVIAQHLTLAENAQQTGRWVGARDSAAHHYQTVLALDPQNLAAQRGIDRVAAELSRRTQTLMTQRSLAEAAASLERLREVQPEYPELPLLESQLRLLQDSVLAALTPSPAAEAPPAKRVEPAPVGERAAIRAAERVETRASTQTRATAQPPRERDVIATKAAAPSPSPKPPVSEAASVSTPIPSPSIAKEPAAIVPPANAPAASAASSVSTSAPQTAKPEPSLVTPTATPSQSPTLPSNFAPSTAAINRPQAQATTPAPAPSVPTPAATPKILKYVQPMYPSEAYARRIEGWVQVGLLVTPSGNVVNARIEGGDKRVLFSRAALAAVKQWKYEPRPQETTETPISVRLDFQLDR